MTGAMGSIGLLRRVSRLMGQSRIRLPRRQPERLAKGDRLQLGAAVWRVRGGLLLASGSWAYRLEALDAAPGERRSARLLIPAVSPEAGETVFWTFLFCSQGEKEERVRVPAAGVAVFRVG
jgi:hypothetical protein